MKKALVNPLEHSVTYVSGWTDQTPAEPIISIIENSYRVAEVTDQIFEVSEPLFWTDCPNEAIADQWYFDVKTNSVLIKPEAPSPNPLLPA